MDGNEVTLEIVYRLIIRKYGDGVVSADLSPALVDGNGKRYDSIFLSSRDLHRFCPDVDKKEYVPERGKELNFDLKKFNKFRRDLVEYRRKRKRNAK